MKIRKFFISNSSSSSFICSVCSEEFSGWDCCPSDYDHTTCENGHIVCLDKVLPKTKEDETEDKYEIPSERCPCCQLKVVDRDEITQYVYKLVGKSATELEREIVGRFSSHSEFVKFLKG